ncbi:MAG TPA: sugar ABC transporter substrate-binding protein [Steroidobacteraceae bacterium]|nr:sugar ABC transporter substrate-binding protein [Steroidobacteraceae bacterium]
MRRALFLAALLLLTGCEQKRTEQAGVSILWVQPLRDHPVHKLMQAGFLQRCREAGYTCDIVGNPSATNFDVSATIVLADAALARRQYSALAIYSPDPAIYPYIAKRAREGFPVVTWHRLPDAGEVPGLSAAAGHDVTQAATDAALAMGKALGGTGAIAVTQGSFNALENRMAADFAAQVRKTFPAITLLDPQLEGFEPSGAKAKAIALLQGNPQLTGAFSTTGNGAETWAGAARTTHRDVKIISMDYTRQNLDLVKAGAVYAIVAQPLYEEGAAVADLGAKLARHETVPLRNVLPAKIVTAADLAPYYQILSAAGQ